MNDDSNLTPRPPSRLADGVTGPVVVPLLQATVTGVLVSLCAVTLIHYLAPGAALFPPFLLIWTGSTLLSWLTYRARWQYVIERVLGVDLDGDGHIGAPVYNPPPPVRVVLEQEQGRTVDFIDLPYADRLPQLAAGLTEGRTFTAGTFNHILHRTEFEVLRDELIRRNLARWKNERAHAQGAELTPAGKAVMRRLADQHTPTPTLPAYDERV